MLVMIQKLHHAAYRCRDAEQTRQFYEDFLGLPLANAFEIHETKTDRATNTLHLFFQMDDGSNIAFFETTDRDFEFKDQHDYDLHVAVQVTYEDMERMLAKGRAAGMEVRGIADHGFIHSIYFRDPNGYVVELTAPVPGHEDVMDPEKNGSRARAALDAWVAKRV